MDIARESNVNYALPSFSNSRRFQVNYFSIREDNAQPYDGTGSTYSKAKFMCSFGGRILPRPSDMKLRYVGGETKMISVPRNIGYAAFLRKMEGIYGSDIILRYQLPEEELDSLVSVSTDEDLENMMEECDRLDCTEPLAKLRVFVFHESEVDNIGMHDIRDPETSEQIFVDAINVTSCTLSSRANAHSQFTEADSSKMVNACSSPWDDFVVKLTECQKPKASPLEDHVSSGNLDFENRLISTEVSHITSTNDAEDFDDLESGRLESSSSASSQWRTPNNTCEETEQLTMAQVYNGSIHHGEETQGKHWNSSTCLHMQVDLKNAVSNRHHCYVPQEFDINSWNSNLLSIDQQKKSQEWYGTTEKVSSVNFTELNDMNNLLLKLDNQGRFHQVLNEDSQQETKIAPPRASAFPSSMSCQEKKPLCIFDSEYFHEQEIFISDEISAKNFYTRYNVPSGIEQMEIRLTPNIEDDGISLKVANIHDFDETPNSTISFVQINHNVEQGDNEKSMHPPQPSVSKEVSCPLSKLNEVLENELLFQDIEKDFLTKDSEASEIFMKLEIDIETFPKRKYSSGLISAEGSTDTRENNNVGEHLEHDLKVLPPSGCNESSKLTAVPDFLCCLQPENPKLHSSPSHPLYLIDDYAYQGHERCIAVVEGARPIVNGFYNLPSFLETASEDLTLLSIQNSFSKEHSDKTSPTFKSDEKKSLKNVKDLDCLVSSSVKDSALVSLIETWERSLLQDDEQTQHAVVRDLLYEEVPEVEDKTAAVEDLGCEFEENDESQCFDNGSVNVATVAEEEARVRGLQTIRNCDLEDLRELGSGTFGTVYHGKWRGSDVAIKRIKASLFAGRQNERERLMADFWHEACLLSKLHHPNVVAFYGVVTDGPGGTLATVSEYMANGSLKQVLLRKDRTLDRRKRLLLAMDAAFGMEYLHGKNVVHFDIKCENLLVNMRDIQRPICKVGDLGLSKVKQKTFVSGGVRGTLPWMAPELLNGSTNLVSEKVDVFSFGIVMWELLTREEPYANMHYGAIIGGIVNNTLRPRIPRSCDPAWRSLMEQCWAADPTERPTFSEIAKRLRAMQGS